jgi:hypothetical protein
MAVNKAVLKAAAAVNKFALFVTVTTTSASKTCLACNGRDCGRKKRLAIVVNASKTCLACNGRDCGRKKGLAIVANLVAELC